VCGQLTAAATIAAREAEGGVDRCLTPRSSLLARVWNGHVAQTRKLSPSD